MAWWSLLIPPSHTNRDRDAKRMHPHRMACLCGVQWHGCHKVWVVTSPNAHLTMPSSLWHWRAGTQKNSATLGDGSLVSPTPLSPYLPGIFVSLRASEKLHAAHQRKFTLW